MRAVIVKFAGTPVPEVKKAAERLGRGTLAGQRRSSIFQGFILSSAGQAERSVVTAIELPITYSGLRNYVSGLDVGDGLPKNTSRREVLYPSLRPDPILPLPLGSAAAIGSRLTTVYYFGTELSGGDRLDFLSASPQQLFYRSGAVVDQPRKRLRFGVDVYVEQSLINAIPSGALHPEPVPWKAVSYAVVDSLRIDLSKIPKGGGGFSLIIGSGLLSYLYGSRIRMVGMPYRFGTVSNVAHTPLDGGPAVPYFFGGTPTPFPRLYPEREGDVAPFAYASGVRNPWPFMATLEAPGARPQHCLPWCENTDSGVLVAFPVVSIPDGFDVLTIQDYDPYAGVEPAPYRVGNISARSMVMGDNTGARAIGYGTPMLALLNVTNQVPMTQAEVDIWSPGQITGPSPAYGTDQRYVYPQILEAGPQSPSGADTSAYVPDSARIIEGELFPAVDAHAFVSLYDLPEWVWPQLLDDVYRLRAESFAHPDPAPADRPRCLSGQRLSCVFGDVRSTRIGDEMEFVFSVSSRTSSLVAPIEAVDPDMALCQIYQTKTALVFVRATLVERGVDVEPAVTITSSDVAFRDVIGPARSGLIEPEMDTATARLPSVIWSGVMAGKRAYLVRAVRYERNLFCGSFEQDESASFVTSEFWAERGWTLGSGVFTGCSAYDLNVAYGPKPDTDQFEELWLITDGDRTVISLPGNGLLRPVIDGAANYYADGLRPLHGYDARDKKYWMLLNSEHQIAALRDRWVEEAVGYGATFNTVTQISDTDVLVLLHPIIEPQYPGAIYSILRINCVTGESSTVYTGLAPTEEIPGKFASLTCFQQEVVVGDEIAMHAHLFWRTGQGNNTRSGQVAISADGGASWTPVFTDLHTETLSEQPGVVGLGVHLSGMFLASGSSDPASPFFRRKRSE